jgi:L-ribulose-5-phosphate 3-epimerase
MSSAPVLLKSINYWSYPGGFAGTLTVADFARKAKAHGFEAIELCIGGEGVLTPETSQSECEDLVAAAEKEGIPVRSVASGLYWANSLGDPDPAKSSKAKDELIKMIQITRWLGCRTLLTIVGAVDVFFAPDREVQPVDLVMENARQGLREVLPVAESHGIILGLENVWNRILLTPMEMRDFIDSFASDSLGAYVDVGNCLPFAYADQFLRTLGPRVAGIHFKDFRRAAGTDAGFVDLLEGDVNWPEVMAAIHEIGYQGPLVAEMIPLYRHYPEVRCANTSRAMDAILGR